MEEEKEEKEEEEEQDKEEEVSSVWAMHSLGQNSDQGSTLHYTSAFSQLKQTFSP